MCRNIYLNFFLFPLFFVMFLKLNKEPRRCQIDHELKYRGVFAFLSVLLLLLTVLCMALLLFIVEKKERKKVMSEKCTRGELKKKRFKEQFLTFYVSFHFSIGSRSLACTEAFNAYKKNIFCL